MNPRVLLLVLVAAAFNVGTVFALKASQGMRAWVPTVAVVITICACQFFLAKAMDVGGLQGPAIALNVAIVIIAASVIGWVWYGERLTAWQMMGLALTLVGAAVANLAGEKSPHAS